MAVAWWAGLPKAGAMHARSHQAMADWQHVARHARQSKHLPVLPGLACLPSGALPRHSKPALLWLAALPMPFTPPLTKEHHRVVGILRPQMPLLIRHCATAAACLQVRSVCLLGSTLQRAAAAAAAGSGASSEGLPGQLNARTVAASYVQRSESV